MNYYLLSINPEGWGLAVKPERDAPTCNNKRQHIELTNDWQIWLRYLGSLPTTLVEPSFAKTLKTHEWFEAGERYEKAAVKNNWKPCSKEEFENQHPACWYRIVLIPLQGEKERGTTITTASEIDKWEKFITVAFVELQNNPYAMMKYVKENLPPQGSGKEDATIQTLLSLLAQYGGTIESTGKMDEMNIKQARASGRMWVDENGLGYLWMPDINSLPTTPEEVEQFEKWFPLPVELPDSLKNLDWLHNKPTPKEDKREDYWKGFDFEAKWNESIEKLKSATPKEQSNDAVELLNWVTKNAYHKDGDWYLYENMSGEIYNSQQLYTIYINPKK